MSDHQRQAKPSRIEIYRSKEAGVRWAARFASVDETRKIFERLADQYRSLAEELELLDKLDLTAE